MNSDANKLSSSPKQLVQRLAIFLPSENRKPLIARLSLTPNERGGAEVKIEGESEEQLQKIRDIIEASSCKRNDQPKTDSEAGEARYDSTRLIKALEVEGFGVEDISSGDYQVQFEIDLQSGFHIAAQRPLHEFVAPNDPLGTRVAEAIVDSMRKIPDGAAQQIAAAVANGDPNAIVAAIKSGREAGAMNVRPTASLFDALFGFDIAIVPVADRRMVRECRLCIAHLLGRTEAGEEAQKMLCEEAANLDETQKTDLEMIVALGEMKKGRPETALHMWHKLLERPEVLGAGNRGWAWRNIALASPRNSSEARHANKCSADAFLEAGDKREASRSLMMLANSLLHEEPAAALKTINEILALIEQNGLLDRELRAATLHARGNRLLQMGRCTEAAADAREAIVLRRGLIGAEEHLISSLHLADIAIHAVGDEEAANGFAAEADRLTTELKAPHFKLARRVADLLDSYDPDRAAKLLRDAEVQKNEGAIASVRIAQVMKDSALSDADRLSLLEDTVNRLDKAGVGEGAKEPVRLALAGELRRLGKPERAEEWYRKVLESNPFNTFAGQALVQSLWQREQWSDAAIVLKKQIDLRGPMPGLCYAYGRSLSEGGNLSGALPVLTQALDLADDNPDLKKVINDLREKVVRQKLEITAAPAPVGAARAVTREEFDAALDEFCYLISADQRMTFWVKKRNKHIWIPRPEKRAQEQLYLFLKTKFGVRVEPFQEIGSGAGRLDIYVLLHGGLAFILELKMCGAGYSANYAAAGETQLLHYMKNRRSNLGYLIIFDARATNNGQALLKGGISQTVFNKHIDMRPTVSARSSVATKSRPVGRKRKAQR